MTAFYAEVRRVARPGAAIALVTYAAAVVAPAIKHVLRTFLRDTLGPYWPPERQVVDSGYRTLPFPFAELAVPDMAMTADWDVDDMIGYLDTWSAVRNYERANGASPIPKVREAMLAVWPPGTRHIVRWPLAIRAGRVDA